MIVAVSGYYGHANTGDEAILLAITRELKRLGHRPLVLSATPRATASAYGVESAHRMRPAQVWRAIGRADALLSGGGGLLQDKTSSRTLQYYLALIRLARLRHKRVAVFNQSVGPLSAAGERAVSRALRGVRAIARDTASVEYLRRLGAPATLGGDPALLLEPPAVPREGQRVVLAPRGGEPEATARLVELARRLRADGRPVTALGLQPGVDSPEVERLAEVSGVQAVVTPDPDRALAVLAGAGRVAGVRLHALILGAAARTGFVGVAYDPKVAAFCRDAGAPHHPVAFDVASVHAQLAGGAAEPDWAAVEAMAERARQSFRVALG